MSFWSKSLSILLDVGSNRHAKRQTTTTQVPAVCFNVCNDAGIVAIGIGSTPALCKTGGEFESVLAECTTCIQENVSTTNVATVIQLNEYITYCDSLDDDDIASAQSVISSASSQEAALSRSSASLASVQASEDSVLGITPSSSTFKTTTSHTSPSSSTNATTRAIQTSTRAIQTSTRAIQTSTRAIQTSSPTPLPAPTSNTKTIIGAAVGGSIGGLLIVAVIAGIFIKRRRKQRKVAATATQSPEKSPEKAQLHSDDYKPPREELLGTLGKNQYDHTKMSELPSNEPVEKTKELPANEEVGAELDNRVRTPKPEGSSQSTKVGSGPDG